MKNFGIYNANNEAICTVLANNEDEALTVFKSENPKAQVEGVEGFWAEEVDA